MSKNVFRIKELEDETTIRVWADLAQNWAAIKVSGPDTEGQWTAELPVGDVYFKTKAEALAYGALWANRAEHASIT